jgi:phosphatidylglycerol:prolipoprotein diacylglycerol transferase
MFPTLFQIGSFKLASFGVAMVFAFLLSLAFARARAAKYGLLPDQVSDVSFYAIIGGILGARAFFILQDLPYYLKNLDKLFAIQFQGLTSFGGFIVGGIVAYIVCRKKKISPVAFLDLAAPAFLIGHIIGRIGCLLNGCCHGRPSDHAFPFAAYSSENHMHNVPAQLYDSVMNLVAFFVVLKLTKGDRKPGYALAITFILHGITRFIYEFFRAGSSSTTIGNLPFTEGHVFAMLVSLAGVFILLKPVKQPVVTQ